MKQIFPDSSVGIFYLMNRSSLIAQLVKNPPAMQETPVQFLGWEDPLEKRQATQIGYPLQWASLVAKRLKHLPAMWGTWVGDLGLRPGFDPWVRKIPQRRKWQPTPVFLPGESHGWRSLVGYSSGGRKVSDTTEQLNLTQRILRKETDSFVLCRDFSKREDIAVLVF